MIASGHGPAGRRRRGQGCHAARAANSSSLVPAQRRVEQAARRRRHYSSSRAVVIGRQLVAHKRGGGLHLAVGQLLRPRPAPAPRQSPKCSACTAAEQCHCGWAVATPWWCSRASAHRPLVTTGTPSTCASRIGIPSPSVLLGWRSTSASAVSSTACAYSSSRVSMRTSAGRWRPAPIAIASTLSHFTFPCCIHFCAALICGANVRETGGPPRARLVVRSQRVAHLAKGEAREVTFLRFSPS